MQQVAQEINQWCHLGVLDVDRVVIIARSMSSRPFPQHAIRGTPQKH